jgi:hypothetical protein
VSTDIYIPLIIALGQPGQFVFKAALNGSIESAREEISQDMCSDIDYEYIRYNFDTQLLCKFGGYEYWRQVDVFGKNLHISVGGEFRTWIIKWLDEMGYEYSHITGEE